MAKKKSNKKQLSAPERHFGVILEDIDSKMDLVLEGHQALDVKFSKKIEDVSKKIKDVDGKIDIHTEMIGSMAADVEIIKTDIELIKNSLKKKIDIEEFAVLEKRVLLLERKLQRI
ncbi:hypothetical protein COS59_00020 [Candidatus Wolfebacteria bacterium CG03_land_8_20_14_0_80_36_15]|uniref:t-SNARE coiled-coil homology domain-containing protein n=1 Tax=Candidatus Wolfebacteria bacterium CG03_land_8_20_14_0_80_36_15 TaxID=1975067 RepID=A0A2M7B8E6_9BACT|nr:MAG: hypothetical protein COS59_00020 [Candidatus Wolfebacteria bacterium CG03_land_8_20_14_0_80_36_15]